MIVHFVIKILKQYSMYLLPVIKSYICGIISVCMCRGKLPKYLTLMSVMEVSGKTSMSS